MASYIKTVVDSLEPMGSVIFDMESRLKDIANILAPISRNIKKVPKSIRNFDVSLGQLVETLVPVGDFLTKSLEDIFIDLSQGNLSLYFHCSKYTLK